MDVQPKTLQIHRDFIKPGCRDAYREVEQEIARTCVRLDFPHAYLAFEPLRGPDEVWFLNAWNSDAEQREVAEAYAKNLALADALTAAAARKRELVREAMNTFAGFRGERGTGPFWRMGAGRFAAIALARTRPEIDGVFFEGADGSWFVFSAARSGEAAESLAAAAGAATRAFAVRPELSKPAPEWIAADPAFWQVFPDRARLPG